jgi:NTP pyrophosphatase (non-canonical NTP hydrolase)
MTFEEYQRSTCTTAIYHETCQTAKDKMAYLISGLTSEAGEVAGKHKKWLRGDFINDTPGSFSIAIAKELGDVLWYAAQIAELIGTPLESIAAINIHKLAERQNQNKLRGEGDNR